MRWFFRGAVMAIAMLLFSSCGLFFPENRENVLVGTWRNSLGAVWTIKPNGTFDVDLTQNGRRDVGGKYDLIGDKLILKITSGLRPKGCDGKGIYRFARVHDTLQLTLIQDDCRLRKKNMLLVWKLKAPWHRARKTPL